MLTGKEFIILCYSTSSIAVRRDALMTCFYWDSG